jgi:anti-anti-sigma factor
VNQQATLTGEWHDGVPVAHLQGEIDASNAREIGDRLRALLTNRLERLVVDLSQTTYLDSTGINLLFTLGDELRGRQQSLRLVVGERSPIARMLTITGLDRAHPTFPTLADALGGD